MRFWVQVEKKTCDEMLLGLKNILFAIGFKRFIPSQTVRILDPLPKLGWSSRF